MTLRRPAGVIAIALCTLVQLSCTSDGSVDTIRLIYDGDVGPDPCDFTTLSLLHEYHNRGMIELMGVIGSTPDPHLASTTSVYNQIYGGNAPIGAYSESSDDVAFDDETKRLYSVAISFTTHADQNETIYENYGSDETQTADDVFGPVAAESKSMGTERTRGPQAKGWRLTSHCCPTSKMSSPTSSPIE